MQEFAKIALYYADQGDTIKALATAQLIAKLDPENDAVVQRLRDLTAMQKAASAEQIQQYQESIQQIEELEGAQAEAPTNLAETDAAASAQIAEEVIQALKQIPLFAKLSMSELRAIQTYSLLHTLKNGDPLFTGGNVHRSLFAILEGSVKIWGKDKDHQNVALATLSAGTSFGEFGLFGRIDTTVSVIAQQPARVLEIPRDVVLKLAKTRPAMIESLKDLFRRRILENGLARVPLFSRLTSDDRRKIMKYFKPVKAKQGITLMREGTVGDSMFFIMNGEVGVYTNLSEAYEDGAPSEAEQLLLATLSSGDFFGEQALMTNQPRSATVIAQSEVMMLRFTKADLQAVIQEYPAIEAELQVEAFENLMRKNMTILNQLVGAAS
jgi:monovalent cation:H+ antiporter, CPA1 family